MWKREGRACARLARCGTPTSSSYASASTWARIKAPTVSTAVNASSAASLTFSASYMTPPISFEQQLSQMKGFQKKRFLRHPWVEKVSNVSTLSDDQRILIFLAGNTAAGNLTDAARDWCYLDPTLHTAGTEVMLQNVIFAGVPKMLNAFSTIAELGIESRSVVEKEFNPASDTPDYSEFSRKGEEMMKDVFINKYERLREKMAYLHPALDKWLAEFLYGRLRIRPGLDFKMRQLCALSALAGDVVWPQFRSSIIATLEEVRAVLDATHLIWGARAQITVDALWSDLNKRSLQRWRESKPEEEFSPAVSEIFESNPNLTYNNTARYNTTEHHPYMYVNSKLDPIPRELRILSLLGAHTASGNLTRVAIDWSYLPEDYHAAGLEIILQTGIFAGFQKVINALETVHIVGVSPTAINVQAETKPESRAAVIENGTKLLQLIYNKQYTRLREKMKWMHPDIDKLIVEFPYGRILSRPCDKLTAKERELCSLACLSGQIVFPQLHSHILGALNTGSTLREIRGIFDQTEYVWGRGTQAMVDGFWLDFEEHYRWRLLMKKQKGSKPSGGEE